MTGTVAVEITSAQLGGAPCSKDELDRYIKRTGRDDTQLLRLQR
jgi:hypothetical protein